MKLPWYVFSKGPLLNRVPILGKSTAQSIGPLIFVPQNIFKDLESPTPNKKYVALLIHEETHRKRQQEMGFLKFGLGYIFNPRFRFNEELLAHKESMRYLKKKRVSYDFEKHARLLSSYLYLWPVSKECAETALKKVWKEL